MAFAPIRRTRLNQPSGEGIDFSHPSSAGILDAWSAPTLSAKSLMGRKPTSTGSVVLTPGKFGIGASAGSSSVKYNVGNWAQSGTFAFLAVVDFSGYGSTASVIRRDGAATPVQVANNSVRSVGWNPVAAFNEYYTTPSGFKADVLITNRVSSTTENLYVNRNLVNTYASFSGYGSTTNPLCFLGTETDGELFTSSLGKFYLGIAWNRALTEAEIISLSANPFQVLL